MTSRFRTIGLALVLGLACAATAAAQQEKAKEKATPKRPMVPPGVKAERDVEYARAGELGLKLDLYVPEGAKAPLPLLIWIHGGGWSGGSKDQCPALPFSARGYVVASVEYRLTGVAPFPAQIEDCRAALRWLRANAEKYQIDPKHVGVWGGSAGGHLVALLGTSEDRTAWDTVGGNTDQSCRVQAVCDFFGPADLTRIGAGGRAGRAESPVGRLLGGPLAEKQAEARTASPVTYVSADDPPFFIVHGDKDMTVPLEQSERLYDVLKKAGVDVSIRRVKNGGHGFRPDSDCDPNPREIQRLVGEFFDKHLKTSKAAP